MRFFLGCVLSAMLASVMTIWLTNPSRDGGLVAQDRRVRVESPVELVRPATANIYDSDGFTPEEAVAVSVYEAVNRGVVNITAKAVTDRLLTKSSQEDTGSGAIIDHEGRILTNFHVVNGAKDVAVTLYNGKTYPATLIGADPLNDLAVIQIEAADDELYPIALGDSRGLRVGMRVFALGNPFGLERTLTTGIISSLNRSLQIHGHWKIKSIIQIDAAINPGSSGGPLLDSHGWLIGINTAIATTSGQSAGVGFAIPASLISRVVPQLVKYGRVIRPESGIDKVYQTEKGLLIAEMRPNGPAERAGLRGPKITRSRLFPMKGQDRTAADLIVAIDDQKVVTAEDFLGYIEGKRPGDEVTLTVIREGRRVPIPLQLANSEPVESTSSR
ncbi:S1C family serine protease [Schlesneria paludicola]|uniref:S1C family serine protease n=1 Tax=Schlesneria paludicola TaxID=360056 RepID=UPI00029AC9F7|nr:trypsin-like peptidase domain-containing protein [Schlesneria paludicola]